MLKCEIWKRKSLSACCVQIHSKHLLFTVSHLGSNIALSEWQVNFTNHSKVWPKWWNCFFFSLSPTLYQIMLIILYMSKMCIFWCTFNCSHCHLVFKWYVFIINRHRFLTQHFAFTHQLTAISIHWHAQLAFKSQARGTLFIKQKSYT